MGPAFRGGMIWAAGAAVMLAATVAEQPIRNVAPPAAEHARAGHGGQEVELYRKDESAFMRATPPWRRRQRTSRETAVESTVRSRAEPPPVAQRNRDLWKRQTMKGCRYQLTRWGCARRRHKISKLASSMVGHRRRTVQGYERHGPQQQLGNPCCSSFGLFRKAEMFTQRGVAVSLLGPRATLALSSEIQDRI